MFHTFGCLRESSSICSQLGRLLRLRAPILNLSLQYTQDLSLRATCLTTGSGMSYLVAFLRTRDGIPHLFVICSPSGYLGREFSVPTSPIQKPTPPARH